MSRKTLIEQAHAIVRNEVEELRTLLSLSEMDFGMQSDISICRRGMLMEARAIEKYLKVLLDKQECARSERAFKKQGGFFAEEQKNG